MRPSSSLLTLLLVLLIVNSAKGQESDLAIKNSFETKYKAVETAIDSAKTLATLDSLKRLIDALEVEFAAHTSLIDNVYYPESFNSKVTSLRHVQALASDRVYLIQEQGTQITELASKITLLTLRLDSLSIQRDRLFVELQESNKSLSTLRDAMRRLSANLQAKDRLIFALIDSIFLPYSKDFNQLAEFQKEAIGRRLEIANIMTRIYEVAQDNVKFIEVTQLQGKDFANAIEQYQQFRNRWNGLRDKIAAVVARPDVSAEPGRKTGRPVPSGAPAAETPGTQVDTLLTRWNAKLSAAFWHSLAGEFSAKGITLAPFSDAPSFSSSLRAYIASLKSSGQDPSVFVEDVWTTRIDKDWRDALSKETMLGKVEYAALDKLVSDLGQDRIDLKFILYAVCILAIAFGIWWFWIRKPRSASTPPPAA